MDVDNVNIDDQEVSSSLPYSFSYICSRSSYPFYILSYYIEWITTSWTDGILCDY